MLATLGFIITSFFFLVFAYTFEIIVIKNTKLKISQFAYAYYALAVAFYGWGLASLVNDPELLKQSVIFGDVLLLAGTLFMIELLLSKKYSLTGLLSCAAIGAGLIYARAQLFPPEPYMDKGILIFNTQRPVAIVVSLIFLCIWLPVSIRVARQVAHKIRQDSLAIIYSRIYVVSTLSAIVFLATKRLVTVILSFTLIALCFTMLIASNLLAKTLLEKHGRAAK